MKLDLYGCTYVEELNYIHRIWNMYDSPRSWDSLDELNRKKEKISNRKFDDYYKFCFTPDKTKPISIDTFDVDKFDPNELIKLEEKEYKILHHSYNVENNRQIVIIDKELQRESLSQEVMDKYHKEYLHEKDHDILEINEYIKEKEITKKEENKSFWSKLFK